MKSLAQNYTFILIFELFAFQNIAIFLLLLLLLLFYLNRMDDDCMLTAQLSLHCNVHICLVLRYLFFFFYRWAYLLDAFCFIQQREESAHTHIYKYNTQTIEKLGGQCAVHSFIRVITPHKWSFPLFRLIFSWF